MIFSQYDTQDGLFDVCFSEFHENQLVTAGGDGSIKLWDTSIPVSFSGWSGSEAHVDGADTELERTRARSFFRQLESV
jgi:WD40 repeat protein